MTFDSWVSIYNKPASTEVISKIYDTFSNSIVIGFELPDYLRKILDLLDYPYIDFTIHPIRFMQDLLFGVRTNIKDLAENLQPWVVAESDISIEAGLRMASLTRLPPIQEYGCINGAALFCAQTVDDKVLIRDHRMMQAKDFLEDFMKISRFHDRVLVKPHPFSEDNPIISALTQLFSNTVKVRNNFYHLLAQDGISHVYSISSSTSIEARYFQKSGTHLAKYPYSFSTKICSPFEYLTVGSDIFSPPFWTAILNAAQINVRAVPEFRSGNIPNTMRKSLRSYWGADIFEFP